MSEHNGVIKLKCGFRGQILTLQDILKIPQIGPKSANRLLVAGFDSLEILAALAPNDIATITGISYEIAENSFYMLNKKQVSWIGN